MSADSENPRLSSDADETGHFIFCTGIENSYPVITNHRGQSMRRDGMQLSEHYRHWRRDFQLVRQLGIRFLRYGSPYYKSHRGPQQYDWTWAQKTFPCLRQMGITPIADLCHFGLPDWVERGFQDAQWPPLFAQYSAEFASRFPWIRLYTPVNEIFICAQFSGLRGWWNERLKSHRAFVTGLKHMCQATILAEEAILKVRPDALFIQSESSTYFHPQFPNARGKADFMNEWRFLALDLCYGHQVNAEIYEYLADNGIGHEEYRWFIEHGAALRPHCIMGSDYYASNEKKITDASGRVQPSGEVLGYYEIAKQYFDRYHLPIFHTETNKKNDADAPQWLWKEWFNIIRLKTDGIPILGFTWYSLLDQTDWDVALREDNERIVPMGLYDLQRRIRTVGREYKRLIAAWRDWLPLESMRRNISEGRLNHRARKPAAAEHGKSAAAHRMRVIPERPPKPRRRKVIKSE